MREGIEPTTAAPSQPDCSGVSRSDHSAGSMESASNRRRTKKRVAAERTARRGTYRRRKRRHFCSLFENEKERERGSNLRRQRLAIPTAHVLVALTNSAKKVNKKFLLFLQRLYLSLHAFQLPFSSLSCAGSSWLPLPLVSFPSFSLLPSHNRPCQSERSPKARHEADSFEPAEWSEQLTPGQSGWLAIGTAAVGSILALALSHAQKVKKIFFRAWRDPTTPAHTVQLGRCK